MIILSVMLLIKFFELYLPQMQNLEVKDAILTTKKTKFEIKKELEDSTTNGKKNEKMDI